MGRTLSLTVNGSQRTTNTDEDRPLMDVLREDFQLTGTKYGCGEGECGACTVLVGGVPTRSCITSIGEVEREHVETIEGLSQNGRGAHGAASVHRQTGNAVWILRAWTHHDSGCLGP